MKLKLGNWAGGADGQPEGTVTWAGGKTDFSKAPFDMYVQDVSITNYNPAASYEYSDKSGSWQSIKINKDDGSSSNGSSSSASPSSGSSTIATTSTSASSAPTSTTGANNSTSTGEPEKEPSSSSIVASSTTEAYTSAASVEPIDQHTEAAVSVTQTGSMYSTNTASASALNSAISAATSTLSTSVSDSKQTGNSGGNSNWTGTSSAGAAEQTTNAGVKLGAAGSVVGLALGVMLL